jgi:nucleotide-binding universal stress UspA family protein
MSDSARRPVVVVGSDGSEASCVALVLAGRRAGRIGRVFVVHAYELPLDFVGSPNYQPLLSESTDRGRALLDALPLTGNDEQSEIGCETELIGGPPAQAIDSVARGRDADEIVGGARRLGRVRALPGSVSHELLHIADWPALVIPTAAVENGPTRPCDVGNRSGPTPTGRAALSPGTRGQRGPRVRTWLPARLRRRS